MAKKIPLVTTNQTLVERPATKTHIISVMYDAK